MEYMLYHQKRLAHAADGSRFLSASQSFSPATRRFDWRQSQTSDRSRKYQPFPTIPCSRGSVPVRIVDWTEQVTAGSTVVIGAVKPSFPTRAMFGASLRSFGVRPTTLMT